MAAINVNRDRHKRVKRCPAGSGFDRLGWDEAAASINFRRLEEKEGGVGRGGGWGFVRSRTAAAGPPH